MRADAHTVTDDEIAALLAAAKARSEANTQPPPAPRAAGRTHVLVDLLRMVPLVVTVVFVVILLGNATGFL